MSELPPQITVIIAARTGQTPQRALDGLSNCRLSRRCFEVLQAGGCRPSRQRNLAAKEAKGEILYFLDDDSVVCRLALERLLEIFARQDAVAAVGGPSLCHEDAPPLQRIFAALMGSWLVFGPSCARYRRVGRGRVTTEKELILCNLAVRRVEFERLGGFDEWLYPNEENAFLDRLAKEGRSLWYDPDLLVYRYPRGTVAAFLVMFFRYGRGRGEQVRRHPGWGSVLNFAPALFVLWLAVLAGLGAAFGSWGESWRSPITWPLWLYAALLASLSLKIAYSLGIVAGVLAAPLAWLAHCAYGIGLWKGLFFSAAAKRAVAKGEIVITHVDLDGAKKERR